MTSLDDHSLCLLKLSRFDGDKGKIYFEKDGKFDTIIHRSLPNYLWFISLYI